MVAFVTRAAGLFRPKVFGSAMRNVDSMAPLPKESSMLRISKADYDLIRWEAEHSYPYECCGIILGVPAGGDRLVTMTLKCDNARADAAHHRYSINPEQVVAALKLARSRSESIIGFYHSHPDCPPRYSTTDLTEAHWFGCSYVITSVDRGRASATDSYMLVGAEDRKKFLAEEIEIVTNAQPLGVAL
jgi:proteasome lid subunit RPN8/RPN11